MPTRENVRDRSFICHQADLFGFQPRKSRPSRSSEKSVSTVADMDDNIHLFACSKFGNVILTKFTTGIHI